MSKKPTPRQELRASFPSPCDPEWLSSLKKGDRIIYVWRGSAGHLYPYLATFLRRGKTFIEIQVDVYDRNGETDSTCLAEDGMMRWHDVNYCAHVVPFEKLQEEFEQTNNHRRKFNLTAKNYGLSEFDFSTFEKLYGD